MSSLGTSFSHPVAVWFPCFKPDNLLDIVWISSHAKPIQHPRHCHESRSCHAKWCHVQSTNYVTLSQTFLRGCQWDGYSWKSFKRLVCGMHSKGQRTVHDCTETHGLSVILWLINISKVLSTITIQIALNSYCRQIKMNKLYQCIVLKSLHHEFTSLSLPNFAWCEKSNCSILQKSQISVSCNSVDTWMLSDCTRLTVVMGLAETKGRPRLGPLPLSSC